LTDTLVTCAFALSPKDFPALLVGESYTDAAVNVAHAHEVGMLRTLGADFVPKYHYVARPKDSPHGGSLDVYANEDKSLVIAHLYIE
jgi:hypothetical protein